MLHFKDREELARYIEKSFAQFERKERITVEDDDNPIDSEQPPPLGSGCSVTVSNQTESSCRPV